MLARAPQHSIGRLSRSAGGGTVPGVRSAEARYAAASLRCRGLQRCAVSAVRMPSSPPSAPSVVRFAGARAAGSALPAGSVVLLPNRPVTRLPRYRADIPATPVAQPILASQRKQRVVRACAKIELKPSHAPSGRRRFVRPQPTDPNESPATLNAPQQRPAVHHSTDAQPSR